MPSKYIKCFDEKKSKELQEAGFEFLYERDGVYYHKVSKKANFSNSALFENTKISHFITF